MAQPAIANIVNTLKYSPELGATKTHPLILGAIMAHGRKKPPNPSNNKRGSKLPTNKNKGNETGLDQNTMNMINEFINPPMVFVCYVFLLQ